MNKKVKNILIGSLVCILPLCLMQSSFAYTQVEEFSSDSRQGSIRVDNIRDLRFTIKNNKGYPLSVEINKLDLPIYRDNSVRHNCGDTIADGKACHVQYLVYPTKEENINQELNLKVNGKSHFFNIELNVEEDKNKAIKIAPTSTFELVSPKTKNNEALGPRQKHSGVTE